ncbi:MAG: ATP-binding protein [Burkholderiaceae bacterium]
MRLNLARARLRSRIVVGGVALIAVIVGSAAYDAWRLHEQLMSASDRELGNLANALADQASRSFQAVDVLLRDTATWYESSGRGLDGPAVEAALSTRVVAVPQASVLTIVDAQGRQRFRSRQTGEPLADVSDRPYFTSQRQNAETGLFINEPVVTRTERLPALVVSRRLNRPDGSFDGVVTAIVTVVQLQGMYAAISLGEGSALLLTLNDGTLVARQPAVANSQKRERFEDLVALKGGALVDRVISPVDNRAKLIAAVGVRNQALTLAITRDEAQALQPWYEELGSAVVRTVLLSALVLVTMGALLRQLRRLDAGERALSQSEQRYAMAMQAANEGHGEWDISSDQIFISEKWRLLHGLGTAGLVTWAELSQALSLHPEDLLPVRQAIQDHLAGVTEAIELEYRVRPGPASGEPEDGEWRWIHARARCIFDEENTPLKLFFAATDVTARRDAEAQRGLLESRLQRTQRLEALGTLAGGIAHDFNNILGAILGFGEMAQRQTESGQPIRRHLDHVLQAGARARLLVRRILDFSRVGVSERVPVNLHAVIDEVVAMLMPSLPAGQTIRTDLQAGNAAVLGDATQLYQVVMNLCTNALRAMGDSGVLEITARRAEVTHSASLFQGDLNPGAYVCVEVADTGGGIPPEVKAHIFEPFFTTGKMGEGTGLGLSVVHGVISDIGGAIDVADRPGGTLMTLWLPVCGESGRAPPDLVAEWPRGNGEVVMVVDDERPLIDLTEELLASLGYEPVGFESAEAAWRAFQAEPERFDVVLSDEMLPGMPGSEMARQMREQRADLPIVLVSGRLSQALEARAQEIGIDAVLAKPLALQDLADCLARILPGRPRAPLNRA